MKNPAFSRLAIIWFISTILIIAFYSNMELLWFHDSTREKMPIIFVLTANSVTEKKLWYSFTPENFVNIFGVAFVTNNLWATSLLWGY